MLLGVERYGPSDRPWRWIKNELRVPLKTHFENLKRRFFSETRQQKRSLAALNEYFANEVSAKKTASKVKQGFLEVPLNLFFACTACLPPLLAGESG